MIENDKIYEITITEEGLDTYRDFNVSAETMGEYLCINDVMTDFEWDEDINRGVILYARIIDGVLVEEALRKLEDVEYIDTVEESIRYQ